MKQVILLAALTVISSVGQEMRGFGHTYFAVGRHETLGAGAGGDVLLYRGAGAAVDAGYLFNRNAAGSGIGLASANGVYHFARNFERPDRSERLVPFATAGYGIGFRSGHANLFNYGAGVNWWFSESLGLRAEVRDYRNSGRSFVTQFRVGLSFR